MEWWEKSNTPMNSRTLSMNYCISLIMVTWLRLFWTLMKQTVSLVTIPLSVTILLALLFGGCDPATKESRGIKVIMVRAPQYYCDEELFHIRAALQKNNIGLVVASTTTAEALGERLGVKIKPDITIHEVDIKEFDGVVIGSGTGCKELWQDENLREIVKLAYAQNKFVAAGCNAPVVLARAGILKGRRATVFPNNENIMELKNAEAVYTNEPLVVDGNIITSRDLMSLKDFAGAIVEAVLR
jgi:protease I